MGWLFTPGQGRRELIEHLTRTEEGDTTLPDMETKDGGRFKYETLAHCCVGWNVLWSVIQKTITRDEPGIRGNKETKSYRFIVCFMLQNGGDRDGWGYKDVDESMGPYQLSCPLKYLDLAPDHDKDGNPIDLGSFSKEWRLKVRAYWKQRAESCKMAATLKTNDVFSTGSGERPLVFQGFYRKHYVLGLTPGGQTFRFNRNEVVPHKSP